MDEERIAFYRSRIKKKAGKYLWFLLLIPLVLFLLMWGRGRTIEEKATQIKANQDFMKIAGRINDYIVSIHTFDARGNLKNRCRGFFLRKSKLIVTIRSAFSEAASFEVSNGAYGKERGNTFCVEQPQIDLIFISAYHFSYALGSLAPDEKVQPGKEIFILANLEKKSMSWIEGRVDRIENLQNWLKSYILSCEFPEELNGSPVFTKEGNVIGLARSIEKSDNEKIYFVIPLWIIMHAEDKKEAIPLERMSSYIHPQFLPTFPDHLTLARFLFEKGSSAQAAACIYEYLKSHPHHVKELYLLGKYSKSNNWSRAVDCFQKVLSLDPGHREARIELALTYFEQDKITEAKPILESVIQKMPFNTEVCIALSKVYLETGDTDSSLRILNEALYTYGISDKRLYLLLGKAYSAKGENMSAYLNFENAMAMDPCYTETYVEMAFHFMKIKNIDSGINFLLKACERLPEENVFHFFLGIFYIWQGNIDGFKKSVAIVKDLDKKKDQCYSGFLSEYQSYVVSPWSFDKYKSIEKTILKRMGGYRGYFKKIQRRENKKSGR